MLFVFSVEDTPVQRICVNEFMLAPNVSFDFYPISPLKLVLTSLTKRLLSNEPKSYETGFLTLDQSKRVLPVSASDETAKNEYPLVGIWFSDLPSFFSMSSSSATSPNGEGQSIDSRTA
jgi:hypothetical protein